MAAPALSTLPALDGLRAVAAGLVVLTHVAFLTGFGTDSGMLLVKHSTCSLKASFHCIDTSTVMAVF